MNLSKTEFIISAAGSKDFIRDGRPCVVFAGKSNVGKSSVINRLLNRRNFARVGATPGKTVHINYFLIDGKAYFTDLPGYGYAKVSRSEKERWGKLMEEFFAEPQLIDLGVLIVDARHKPTGDDVTMSEWFRATGRPLVIVANKCDKLNKTEMAAAPAVIRETLSLDESVPLILFSAEKGTGRDELTGVIVRAVEG